MAVQPQFLAWILEQLAALRDLRSNRMFGGVGLYSEDLFFGLIDDDTLYFKTDDSNIAPYRERRMPRFMPFPDKPESVLGYHQVPADVMEDAEMLADWARRSVAVALAAQSRKARSPRPKQSPVRKNPVPKKTQPKKCLPKKTGPAKSRPAAAKKPAPKKRRR